MMECNCCVRDNRHLGDGFFQMTLVAPDIARLACPGQFIMLATGGGIDPLLKRPFGILDTSDETVSILYEIVGRGTKQLSEVCPGRTLATVGPLGNGFPDFCQKKILLVAGGRGFAPLFLAAKALSVKNEVSFRYGARSQAQLKLAQSLNDLPLSYVELFTEDGSVGKRGRVGDGLPKLLAEKGIAITLSCGPDAMLQALSKLLLNAPGCHYGSFEALMGCGIGICHSCVIAFKDGSYRKVCSDGPVFPLGEIAWPN